VHLNVHLRPLQYCVSSVPMLASCAKTKESLYIVLECPALQDLRERYEDLFQAPQGDAMMLFMWQDDIIGVAQSIEKC
jgi:hypothetical protein